MQDTCELRVAIRDVRAAVRKGSDDEAERRERRVDLLRLLKCLPARARLGHFLGAREVGDIELGDFGRAVAQLLVQGDREQRMRARRLRVHERRADDAVGVAARKALEHVRLAHNRHLRQRLDVHSLATAAAFLPDGEATAWLHLALRRLQQIAHILLVDLKVRACHRKLGRARVIRGDRLEELAHCSRQQASERVVGTPENAHDGVRLACARLTVREHGRVVTLQHGVHKARRMLIHVGLRGLGWQHGIKRVVVAIVGPDPHGRTFGAKAGQPDRPSRETLLTLVEPTEAGHDSYGLDFHFVVQS